MAARAIPAPLAQIPNALTIVRLILIPVFAVLILSADGGRSWAAAIVFGVAGVTDQIDGWLARRWRVESSFGKVADPLADRLMIDTAVILLWHADRLPWIALAIPARDVALLAGYRLVMRRGYDFQVNFAGKAATWLLYASLGFVMVTSKGTDWPLWIFWAGVVLAGVALAGDLLQARREGGPRRGAWWAGRWPGEGGRDGGRRGHAPAPADLEPTEADGPDRRQALHGAHPRAAQAARAGGGDRHARVHATGGPRLLRQRRQPRPLDRVLRRGVTARHRRLGAPRGAAARRDVPRHLRRRALRRRPLGPDRLPQGEGLGGDHRPQVRRQPARV